MLRSVDDKGVRKLEDAQIADYYSKKNPDFGQKLQRVRQSGKTFTYSDGDVMSPETFALNMEVYGNHRGDEALHNARKSMEHSINIGEMLDAPEGEAPGFFGGVGEDLQKRGQNFNETLEAYHTGKQSLPESVVQLFGQGAGFVGDVIGRGFGAGARGLSAVTPDFIEEPMKAKLKEEAVALLNTPIGQAGVEAIKGGMESYSIWKAQNPRFARNLEAAVNIASIVPIGKAVQVGKQAVVGTVKQGTKLGAKVAIKAGAKEGAKLVEKKLAKQITKEALKVTAPALTKAEKQAALEAGRGLKGLFKTTLKPSSDDLKVAKSIEGLVAKGTVKSTKPLKSISSIRKEISKIDDQVIKALKDNDTPFNEKTLRATLNRVKEDSRVIFGSDKTLQNNYDAVVDEMVKHANKGKKNLSGLLQARRDFDRVVKQKFPNVFKNLGGDNVRSNAILDVRRAVNDFIAETLPTGNKYKGQMEQMSSMFTAIKNISARTASTVDESLLKRAQTALSQHPTLAQLGLLGATAGGGTVLGIISSPVAVGSLLAGGAIKAGGKIITSKTLKKAVIVGLKKLGNPKNAKDASLKKAMQDLLQMLKSAGTLGGVSAVQKGVEKD